MSKIGRIAADASHICTSILDRHFLNLMCLFFRSGNCKWQQEKTRAWPIDATNSTFESQTWARCRRRSDTSCCIAVLANWVASDWSFGSNFLISRFPQYQSCRLCFLHIQESRRKIWKTCFWFCDSSIISDGTRKHMTVVLIKKG